MNSLRRLSFQTQCMIRYGRLFSQNAGLAVEGSSSSLPSVDRQISAKVEKVANELMSLSLLEVAELNSFLKKELNIPDQPMFAAAAAAPIKANIEAEESAPEAAQKTVFAVKLVKFDESKKIALIKEIRNAVEGLNLVQAKKFVETAPVEVKGDLGKNEADALKEVLEKAGATVEIV